MRAVLAVALPVGVFLAGSWLMTVITGRQAVVTRLVAHAALADRKPLNQRLRYRTADVERHWGALDVSTRAIEAKFLKIDLLFPVAYGGALLVAVLLLRPEQQGWLALSWPLLLVAITALADWTENLGLLRQLGRFGTQPLQAGAIAVATLATTTKLLAFALSYLAVLVLAARSFLGRS